MTSVQVAPYSLCGKLDCRFTFDWLTSYPDCNFALNCAGSPRCFSRQDLQDRKWHSLQSGKRTQLQYPFRIDAVLLEIRNQKERCYAWIFDAATKSHPNLEPLLFLRDNRHNHYLVHSMSRLHSIVLSVCT
jgi:hypothetical protein